jgi:hypothetical protein
VSLLQRIRKMLSPNDELPAHPKPISTPRGGVNILGSSGGVFVGGDVVGGNKFGSRLVDPKVIDKLFESVLAEAGQVTLAERRVEVEMRILAVREQAKTGYPDLVIVGTALKWLKANVPSVLPILKSTLKQPVILQSIRDVVVLVLDDGVA